MKRQFIRATVLAALFVAGITGAHAQSTNSPADATPKADLSKPEEAGGKTTDPSTTGTAATSEHFSTERRHEQRRPQRQRVADQEGQLGER